MDTVGAREIVYINGVPILSRLMLKRKHRVPEPRKFSYNEVSILSRCVLKGHCRAIVASLSKAKTCLCLNENPKTNGLVLLPKTM